MKVSFEIATAEIEKWLDSKKISQLRREKNIGSFETLVGLVREGSLVVNDDMSVTLSLNFPIKSPEGTDSVSSLKFKQRMSEAELEPNRKLVGGSGNAAILMATAITVTGELHAILKKCDSIDMENIHNICIFF